MSSLIAGGGKIAEKSFRSRNVVVISKKKSVPMRKGLDLSEVRACLRTIFFPA
jgi:hypothetical protein